MSLSLGKDYGDIVLHKRQGSKGMQSTTFGTDLLQELPER